MSVILLKWIAWRRNSLKYRLATISGTGCRWEPSTGVGHEALLVRLWKVLRGLVTGSIVLLLISIGLVGLDGMRQYAETALYLATSPSGIYFAFFQQMHNWRGLLEDTPLAQQQGASSTAVGVHGPG